MRASAGPAVLSSTSSAKDPGASLHQLWLQHRSFTRLAHRSMRSRTTVCCSTTRGCSASSFSPVSCPVSKRNDSTNCHCIMTPITLRTSSRHLPDARTSMGQEGCAASVCLADQPVLQAAWFEQQHDACTDTSKSFVTQE
eukprot:2154441-Amphidinium_carterae.2